mgnify:FL=1
MPSTQYESSFYSAIRSGCQRSAEAVAPLVLGLMPPVSSLVDVGCGEGWWGAAFGRELNRRGESPKVLGLDSGTLGVTPPIQVDEVDLGQRFSRTEKFDLAICLEVAEHLPPERAETFVGDLCALADVVLFSAAQPRQGGTGHINCQPPAYWAELFRGEGFGWKDELRRRVWQDDRVESWYASNMLMFWRGAGRMGGSPDWLIHPELWLQPR